MEFTFKRCLKTILLPFYVVFIAIPNMIELSVFHYFKRKIKVLRKNVLFLVNPTSGKKLGTRVIEILKDLGRADMAVDILESDYITAVKQNLAKLPAGEELLIVICGGDGTANCIINELEAKLESIENLVFVPMPIGTGNDLSQALNLGCKLGVSYLNEYFDRLNSPKTSIVKIDSWDFSYKPKKSNIPSIKRQMLLYFGLGYDARIQQSFENARKHFRFLFKISVR